MLIAIQSRSLRQHWLPDPAIPQSLLRWSPPVPPVPSGPGSTESTTLTFDVNHFDATAKGVPLHLALRLNGAAAKKLQALGSSSHEFLPRLGILGFLLREKNYSYWNPECVSALKCCYRGDRKSPIHGNYPMCVCIFVYTWVVPMITKQLGLSENGAPKNSSYNFY